MKSSLQFAAIDRFLALEGELVRTPGSPRRKFELAHMHTLLAALGDPQLRFPAVLIAGTNGKGSTAATLASILRAAGYRTGLYTSPHLDHPSERIRVNGAPIPEAVLAGCYEQVEQAAARLVADGALPYSPSFFEAVTALGFLFFAGVRGGVAENESPVDIAVLEVGLGGRLDATNVVEPLLSVITDISLDHMEWLGSTIAAITREKAGILRPGGTLITLPQHPEANQTLGELAVPLGVRGVSATEYLPSMLRRDEAVDSSKRLAELLRNRYELPLAEGLFPGHAVLQVDSPLGGAHQQRNIALAIAAALALRERGFPVDREALETGIRQTEWPGRLELRAGEAGRAPVLLDAAHNPAGAWALRAVLGSLPVAGPRTLVFGCMADKALSELAQVLFPVFDRVLLTRADTKRAASLENLAEAADRVGTPYQRFEVAGDAVKAALAETPETGLVVIAGSIALLGEAGAVLGASGKS